MASAKPRLGSVRAISDGARSPPFGSVREDGHYQSGGAGPSGAPNSAGVVDSKRSGRFEAHDSGSVSDSGAHIHHAKFKRTRRALHLKASDRERLRGPLKALDWRRRSFAIDEDGDETDAAVDDRSPIHAAAAAAGAGVGSSALAVSATGKEMESVAAASKAVVPPTFYRVATYCTCENYDLSECIEYFERSTSFKGALTLYTDVLYIKQKRRRWDIFIFSYGCVTFFNVPVEEEEAFLKSLKPFETGSVDNREVEDFEFAYGSKSAVRNDEIVLESTSALEKLSVAFAIAQCCKLSIFEERIQKEIDRNKHLPEALSREGKIDLTQREITREIGRLFIERNSVNLHFDILDTPEFFWEQDKYKAVYDRLAGYLELGKRVDILNKRLDIMKELFEMLNDQIDSLHASKLEWIVIWLIVIEVVISVVWQMLIKDILHLFPADGSGSAS